MNKDRLLKLADLLEKDAKNNRGIKFDLRSWGKNSRTKTDRPIPVSCGTTACAVGLACISGVFESEGLGYRRGTFNQTAIVPVFKGNQAFTASEQFFGLGKNDFYHLFVDTSYPKNQRTGARGERAVAKRIRTLVAVA